MVPFLALELALQIIAELRPVIAAVTRHDPDLARQIRRAASSVALNLGEGSERSGKDRAQHYRIAAGSHREVVTALRVATAWGALGELREVALLLDRQAAILFRLTHSR
jgi:four helix bundle protein